MGLAKGTKVYTADGALLPIEEIKVGDSVLAADGSAQMVTDTSCAAEEMFELTQRTGHKAHKTDSLRPLPFDLIRITCSSSQLVMVSSRLVSGLYLERVNPAVPRVKNRADETVSSETTVGSSESSFDNMEDDYLDLSFEDDEGITIADIEEVQDQQEQKTNDGRISTLQWPAKVGDFDTMISNVRYRTRLQLLPFTFVKPIMRKQLSEILMREVTVPELGSMAWLLGFWLGDGYKRHAMFALNKEDHDVNSTLARYGQIWGLTLKIKPDKNSKGAKGSLHKVTPTRNLLTTGNPFWEVVMKLRFQVNKEKNFPSIYAFDENLVRESLIAGLIDSDGYVQKKNVFTASIASVYIPIKCGIVTICRSLGLNVSVSFKPEHTDSSGRHCQDTYTCVISPGSNMEIFKSLLSRCGCIRKGTAKGANPSAGLDPFAETVCKSVMNPKVHFDCKSVGSDSSYNIQLSSDSHGTLVSENNVILCNESKEVNSACASCGSENLERWCPVPWEKQNSKIKKLCEPCYKDFRLSRTRCYNDDCLKILSKFEREQISTSKKVEKILQNGTVIVGFPCLSCDSVMVIDDSMEELYSQNGKKGLCQSCKGTHSMRWYNDEIYKGHKTCHYCNRNFYQTRARCLNEGCTYVHNLESLKIIKKNYRRINGVNSDAASTLQCIKCSGSVTVDNTKTVYLMRDGFKTGKCYSCERTKERKWKRLPWNKLSADRLCDKCMCKYRATATRCLQNKCLRILTKSEIKEMAKKSEIAASLEDGTRVLGYPCFYCSGATYKDEEQKLRVEEKTNTGETCFSCKAEITTRKRLIPWDKQSHENICGACYRRYSRYKTRCVEDKCRSIPNKTEFASMTKNGSLKKLKVAEKTAKLFYKCCKCGGKAESEELVHKE